MIHHMKLENDHERGMCNKCGGTLSSNNNCEFCSIQKKIDESEKLKVSD